jgi:hypothetical protein
VGATPVTVAVNVGGENGVAGLRELTSVVVAGGGPEPLMTCDSGGALVEVWLPASPL